MLARIMQGPSDKLTAGFEAWGDGTEGHMTKRTWRFSRAPGDVGTEILTDAHHPFSYLTTCFCNIKTVLGGAADR